MEKDIVQDYIQKAIQDNDIVLFMKGTAQAPMCGFSGVVCKILRLNGVEFHAVNVMEDPNLREGIKAYTNWPTIPQLYIKQEFMGGCDIVRELHESGELAEILKQKGL